MHKRVCKYVHIITPTCVPATKLPSSEGVRQKSQAPYNNWTKSVLAIFDVRPPGCRNTCRGDNIYLQTRLCIVWFNLNNLQYYFRVNKATFYAKSARGK
jgi:hypothetical protein